MTRCTFTRLKKSECGASLVEFALVVMILLTVIFGIIEFGWIFHGYITLTGAAREGVRLAIVNAEDKDVIDAVKNHARIFNLDDEDIIINDADYDGERSITIAGNLDLLISFPPFPESINLEASATMRQEQ